MVEDEAEDIGKGQVVDGLTGLDFTKIIMAAIYQALSNSLAHWILTPTLYSWWYYFHITYEASPFLLCISM